MQLLVVAGLLAALSLGLLVVASLAPLGLVKPFPDPPVKAGRVATVQIRPINDPATLNRRAAEADREYFKRLAASVSVAVVHWWPQSDPTASRYTRVTFLHDYALWVLAKFAPWSYFQNYEFMSPDRALERGFGFSSQKSRIVYSVLLDNGYFPTLQAHKRHTVIEVDGTVIDPDYGVFIPMSLDELQARSYLVPFFYGNYPDERKFLSGVFASGFDELSNLASLSGMLAFERQTRYLKWQIPVGGLILALIFGAFGWLALRTRRVVENEEVVAFGLVPRCEAAELKPAPATSSIPME